MKDKPVKIPDISFNEALQRIAKFHKDDLPIDKKSEQKTKEKTKLYTQKSIKKQ